MLQARRQPVAVGGLAVPVEEQNLLQPAAQWQWQILLYYCRLAEAYPVPGAARAEDPWVVQVLAVLDVQEPVERVSVALAGWAVVVEPVQAAVEGHVRVPWGPGKKGRVEEGDKGTKGKVGQGRREKEEGEC